MFYDQVDLWSYHRQNNILCWESKFMIFKTWNTQNYYGYRFQSKLICDIDFTCLFSVGDAPVYSTPSPYNDAHWFLRD